MKNYNTKGFLNGIFASVSYGTNPLFALPMYKMGMNVNSVLLYRYLFGVIIYAIWLKFFKKINFKISFREFFGLFFTAILFAFSSLTLFESFNYIPSGVACTILFVYPIIVAIISAIFFREKFTPAVIISIIMTFLGIYILNNGINGKLSLTGLIWVLLSALSYATYIILVRNLNTLKHLKYDKLSFYIMFFGLSVFIVNLKFCTQLQPLSDIRTLVCALGLAVFPTVISLETINIAIRLIGATKTAILGALEPLTALFIGVLVFQETLTTNGILGIVLILSGVTLVITRAGR